MSPGVKSTFVKKTKPGERGFGDLEEIGDAADECGAVQLEDGTAAGLCSPEFVKRADPEIGANAMICAIHQATYLVNRQLKSQRRSFEEKGGFGEELYRSRKRRLGG